MGIAFGACGCGDLVIPVESIRIADGFWTRGDAVFEAVEGVFFELRRLFGSGLLGSGVDFAVRPEDAAISVAERFVAEACVGVYSACCFAELFLREGLAALALGGFSANV